MNCVFVTDLHGVEARYRKLFELIQAERPDALFIGGDLLPGGFGMSSRSGDLFGDLLLPELQAIKTHLDDLYPRIFVIPGNDDPRSIVADLRQGEKDGLWEYIHARATDLGDYQVYGYACVPPSPFQLKDWERYDLSRFVDPGCVSPEEGFHTTDVEPAELRYRTIAKDLETLAGSDDLNHAVFLFHAPPYETTLDRAALDGRMIDHVPMDIHVGSMAIRKFVEGRRPRLTLHGHIHESVRLTGEWREKIGRTHVFGGAHDGKELAVVRFDLTDLAMASRELI